MDPVILWCQPDVSFSLTEVQNQEKETEESEMNRRMGFPGGPVVKDLAWSLLQCKFDPWPGNFCLPWARPHKKRERDEQI